MKNHKISGMIIGSLIGCILAGIFVYFQVSVVIIYFMIVGSLISGFYIGSNITKAED